MSTLKSSSESITINADGNGNDVLIQSNASTKVIVDGATGNLGVGTNTPVMASTAYNGLHVNATYPVVKLSANATGHAATDGFHLRIDSTPRVEYWNYENSDQVFANNNGVKLRLLAGGGLCFGTDTAAANALDDYEEGTFTPTITGAGGGSATHSSQIGRYTKIGTVVNVNMSVGGAKNNISGQMQVSGLPFAANAIHRGFSYEHYLPGGTALVDTQAIIYNNETRIRLWGNTSANNDGTARGLTVSDVNSTASLHFQLTYTTNS